VTVNKPYIRTSIVALFALFVFADTVRTETALAPAGERSWQSEATTVTLSGDTLRVSGKGTMANYVFGSPWHTFPITCVIIEDGVTHIGDKAFMMMNELKSVTIPNSVTTIEGEAFRETGLTSIVIPSSVKFIRATGVEGAFNGCVGLTSITVTADNAEYSSVDVVLFNKDKTVLILYPYGKSGAYTIPGSVNAIGHRAFAVNDNITSIVIPGSVASIGSETFAGCDGLTSVTIEDGVKSIGYLAFWGCDSLKYVTIPRSVTSVSAEAFAGCAGLVSITVAADNANYSSEDGALFNKNKTVLIHYPQGKLGASHAIPDVAYYKTIALLSILTALILFAVIFVIIKKAQKSPGRKRIFFIVTTVALSVFALFAVYIALSAFTLFMDSTFSLKVKVNPKDGGTVSQSGTKRHGAGTTVTLTAKASDGYVFAGWSGASTLTLNPLIITMDGDKVLTANFKLFEPRTVQIGNRRWMAENLNIITGNSWCYDNDERNCQKYGRLYDYNTALEACPAGWRLPSRDDWNSLTRAGGYGTGTKLKSKTGWNDWKCYRDDYYGYRTHIEKTDCTPGNIYSGNGTDEFGFSAPAGGEMFSENKFHYIGILAYWWISNGEWYVLNNNSYKLENWHCIGGCGGSNGMSIRCVQDIPGVPEKVVGSDGPSPAVQSWKSGATTVTFYADGMVRVDGNGEMDGCGPPWREYQRIASMEDCNFPWRYYEVTGLIVEDGVTRIGSHAFDGCHIMASVTIPKSVTSIGKEAFGYCLGLKSIIIRNPNPPKFDGIVRGVPENNVMNITKSEWHSRRTPVKASDAFEKDVINEACLYVPANSVDAYRAAEGWKDFNCIRELASAPGGE
jgi:uncharacterized protein (TIGR02145 family)/uncharacterized repeat protein (TIGR02543 family)